MVNPKQLKPDSIPIGQSPLLSLPLVVPKEKGEEEGYGGQGGDNGSRKLGSGKWEVGSWEVGSRKVGSLEIQEVISFGGIVSKASPCHFERREKSYPLKVNKDLNFGTNDISQSGRHADPDSSGKHLPRFRKRLILTKWVKNFSSNSTV